MDSLDFELTSITCEDLINLNEDLIKKIADKDEQAIVKILSILQKKEMNKELLTKSLIGKTMTKLVSNFQDEIHDKAQNLINIWKQCVPATKKPVAKKEEAISLPHIPKEIEESIKLLINRVQEPSYERIAHMIIKTI